MLATHVNLQRYKSMPKNKKLWKLFTQNVHIKIFSFFYNLRVFFSIETARRVWGHYTNDESICDHFFLILVWMVFIQTWSWMNVFCVYFWWTCQPSKNNFSICIAKFTVMNYPKFKKIKASIYSLKTQWRHWWRGWETRSQTISLLLNLT